MPQNEKPTDFKRIRRNGTEDGFRYKQEALFNRRGLQYVIKIVGIAFKSFLNVF